MATKCSTPHSIPMEQQIWKMKARFPDFAYDRSRGEWRGSLSPTEWSPTYRIRLHYARVGAAPKVHIIRPEVAEDAKHRYSDESLCLYHPEDGDWHPGRFLADTIVPWTAEWLLYYEVWQSTGEWLGPEAPHCGAKRR